MTTRGNDSIVGQLARNNQRNATVLDSLQALAGRPRAVPQAPFNPRQDGDNPTTESLGVDGGAGGLGGSEMVGTAPTAEGSNSPGSVGSGTTIGQPVGDTTLPSINPNEPTLVLAPPQNFNAAVNPNIISDEDFYAQTGRTPNQVDRALMESKRKFMLERGRLPSHQELLYEAQRGMVMQQDNSGVTL